MARQNIGSLAECFFRCLFSYAWIFGVASAVGWFCKSAPMTADWCAISTGNSYLESPVCGLTRTLAT